jgi:hypothetical protein
MRDAMPMVRRPGAGGATPLCSAVVTRVKQGYPIVNAPAGAQRRMAMDMNCNLPEDFNEMSVETKRETLRGAL